MRKRLRLLVELKVGFAEKIANKVHSLRNCLSADLGFEEKIAGFRRFAVSSSPFRNGTDSPIVVELKAGFEAKIANKLIPHLSDRSGHTSKELISRWWTRVGVKNWPSLGSTRAKTSRRKTRGGEGLVAIFGKRASRASQTLKEGQITNRSCTAPHHLLQANYSLVVSQRAYPSVKHGTPNPPNNDILAIAKGPSLPRSPHRRPPHVWRWVVKIPVVHLQ